MTPLVLTLILSLLAVTVHPIIIQYKCVGSVLTCINCPAPYPICGGTDEQQFTMECDNCCATASTNLGGSSSKLVESPPPLTYHDDPAHREKPPEVRPLARLPEWWRRRDSTAAQKWKITVVKSGTAIETFTLPADVAHTVTLQCDKCP